MEEKIVEWLVRKYSPVAILLHGSRTNGCARVHSDYDFLIFTTKRVDTYRTLVAGANVEIRQVVLPINKNNVLEKMGFFCRRENSKIVYDPKGILPSLLDLNEKRLNEGNNFNESDRYGRFVSMITSLDGLYDYKEHPFISFSKKREFYDKAILAWFKFLHRKYKPADYAALSHIKQKDPLFYELALAFIDSEPVAAVVKGKSMIRHLFPDLSYDFPY